MYEILELIRVGSRLPVDRPMEQKIIGKNISYVLLNNAMIYYFSASKISVVPCIRVHILRSCAPGWRTKQNLTLLDSFKLIYVHVISIGLIGSIGLYLAYILYESQGTVFYSFTYLYGQAWEEWGPKTNHITPGKI